VLIDAGLDAPYSCRQGICGACACQLASGEVEMARDEVLEAAAIADGYILTCQAVSLTPEVSIATEAGKASRAGRSRPRGPR
jgi:3-ketosteroid 9alpha-monooxygenase subunit B